MQHHALASSGPRELKRPKPLPAALRAAIGLMVIGRPDDIDSRPLGFVEAAREAGMKPPVLRRYLDRPDVRSYLLAERRTWRAAICAGNEGALLRIRDKSANAMAVVASVKTLEEMALAENGGRPGYIGEASAPGVTICIVNGSPAPVTIEGVATERPVLHGAQEPLRFEPAPPRVKSRIEDGAYPIFQPPQ
jgi:hypothetical protein